MPTGSETSGSSETSQQVETGSPGVPTPSIEQLHGIAPPGKLDITQGNIAENWKTYKQVWNNYAVITSLDSRTEEFRVALFLHCIGQDALRIYNGLPFADETERQSMESIFQKFDHFTLGEVNETYERYVFNSRKQGEGESIEAYVTELRTLAKTCGFCDCMKDTLIRDRIVLGINDQSVRKKLLQARKLTLNQCIDMCHSSEATAQHLKPMSGSAQSQLVSRVVNENAKRKMPRKQKNDWNPRNAQTRQHKSLQRPCNYCGGQHAAERRKCPAWGKLCLKCGSRNHFKTVCKRTDRYIHGVSESQTSDESDIEFLAGIFIESTEVKSVNAIESHTGYDKEIYAEMWVNEDKIRFQVDCGASINILPEKYVRNQKIEKTSKTLRMWNGTEVKPLGTTRVVLRNPKTRKKYSVEFVVVTSDLTPLIGARSAQQMQILTVHEENFVKAQPPLKTNQPEVKHLQTGEQLYERYKDVFERPLGTLPGKVHLETIPEVQPVMTPVRRIPTALKDKLQSELDNYVNQGILQPVEEPTPWVSSLAIATKKSGALRICIDPRPLNKALRRETYHLPVLDEILPDIAQAKVFSTVDLRSGFWHCVLDEESSRLTTFATPFGRYRWCRLPFGLSVSSEIFQKRVNQALEGLDGVLDIVDDILIYGKGSTEEEANADHDRNLEALLQRCRERGIALNKDKLCLRRNEVPFMGHVLTNQGLKIDPEKVEAIQNMPKPEDVEGVQRLNGFVNYLSRFLPRLAEVMEPI